MIPRPGDGPYEAISSVTSGSSGFHRRVGVSVRIIPPTCVIAEKHGFTAPYKDDDWGPAAAPSMDPDDIDILVLFRIPTGMYIDLDELKVQPASSLGKMIEFT